MRENRINIYLIVVGIIGFLAGVFGSSLLLVASLMTILIISLARLWNKYAFAKLSVKRSLSQQKVEFGQKMYYTIELENRKILPLLSLKFEDKISEGIKFVNQKVLTKVFARNMNKFEDIFSLKWYQRTKRSYEFVPLRRGLYQFGFFKLHYSGIFGLFRNTLNESKSRELIVFPRIVPLSKFGLNESQLFGSKMRKGWIFEDPLNQVGVRPYHRSDNIKQINWKASARHNQLESNIYNPSFDKELHIFLNAPVQGAWWNQTEKNKLELGIICAASIIEYSSKYGYQIGLYTNISSKNHKNSSYISVKPGKDSGQRERLLTNLALLQTFSIGKISRIMEIEAKKIKNGSTVIIISSSLDSELKKMLRYYNRFYQLVLICIGNDPTKERLTGIEQYWTAGGESWDEIKSLELCQ